jgi:hypothetical protein
VYEIIFDRNAKDPETKKDEPYCGIIFKHASACTRYLDKMNHLATEGCKDADAYPFIGHPGVEFVPGNPFPSNDIIIGMGFRPHRVTGQSISPRGPSRRLTIVKNELFRKWTQLDFRNYCAGVLGSQAYIEWVAIWSWGEGGICLSSVEGAIRIKRALEKESWMKGSIIQYSRDPCEELRENKPKMPGLRVSKGIDWPPAYINPR